MANLSWTPPTQNEDGSPLVDLAGYRVYWRAGSATGFPNAVTVPASESAYRLTGLPNVGTCDFVVTAINASGAESIFSNVASKAGPPAAPTVGPTITWRERPSVAISKGYGGSAGESNNDTSIAVTVNSTGFTHVVVATKWEGGDTTVTPSDNKSTSSWNSLTKQASPASSQMFWAKIGSPGASHTVTLTFAAAREWKTITVWLINANSGEIELVDEAGATGNSATHDAGTLDNAGGDSVVSFFLAGPFYGTTYTAVAGWTEDADGMGAVSAGAFSRGPETTTSVNPSATAAGGAAEWSAVAAMFKEVDGGGGGATGRGRLVGGKLVGGNLLVRRLH